MNKPALSFGYVLVPADNIDIALNFYVGILGLQLKFRDGDRFAALDCGGVTLALVGPPEGTVEPAVAPALRTTDLESTIALLASAGAPTSAIRQGPHEHVAETRDPHGNVVTFFQPAPTEKPHDPEN